MNIGSSFTALMNASTFFNVKSNNDVLMYETCDKSEVYSPQKTEISRKNTYYWCFPWFSEQKQNDISKSLIRLPLAGVGHLNPDNTWCFLKLTICFKQIHGEGFFISWKRNFFLKSIKCLHTFSNIILSPKSIGH